MYMEDIRIMRKTYGRGRITPVLTAAQEIVHYNASRVGLIISIANAVGLYLAFRETASATNGMLLDAQISGRLELNIKDHGDMVTGPWSAIAAAAGGTAYVVELFLEDK